MDFGRIASAKDVEPVLRAAALGPKDDLWHPPAWLQPHQVDAARRIRCSLQRFRFALLADAVGLGKTYVGLSVASTYASVVVVVPAALKSQWKRVGSSVGIEIAIQTHESLSRGTRIIPHDLIVVDEAHRLRNPNTRRYDVLARSIGRSHLLLLTATPVVNKANDLVNMLRLALPDHTFAFLGITSLEGAVSEQDYASIVHATAPVIVARSPSSITGLTGKLPKLRDESVIRPPTAAARRIAKLLNAMDNLQFPSVVSSHESALLTLHLLYRLSSSMDAFRETIRRHLAYIDRAISAAQHGECLSRVAARRIFSSEYDLQLELNDLSLVAKEVDVARLKAERDRLDGLVKIVAQSNGYDPKAAALARILAQRCDRKTIVFTSAVATAHRLARLLGWHQLAVVGAGKAWIASGRLPVEEALSLFAPVARGAPEPPPTAVVHTLIATDFASEGLDLQDADAVVHYDLPWTPLKLEQRIGRIARLGSRHDTAQVWWFAPPIAIERRLQLESRIARKVRCQLNLSVAATSRVGKAQIVNQLLDEREILGQLSHTPQLAYPLHAVVRKPYAAAIALRWKQQDVAVPELLVLREESGELVHDYTEVNRVLQSLSSAAPSSQPPPEMLVNTFLKIARQRLAAADRGPVNQATRRLARRLVKLAYIAGKKRDVELVGLLDAVLERLRQGVAIGAERSLEELLSCRAPSRSIQDWLEEQPLVVGDRLVFDLVAAICGDGSGEKTD